MAKIDFIKIYSKFIVEHPGLVIIIALLLTIGSFSIFGRLVIDNPSVDEIIPSKFPVVSGINKLSDNLGGGESTAFLIVIELEPEEGSDIIDIRDPKIVRYSKLLSDQIINVEDITSTSGIGDNIYKFNNQMPVNSINEVKEIIEQSPNSFSRIVNDKYTLTLIRVSANEGFNIKELENEVQKIIDNTPKPIGIKVTMAGEEIAGQVSQDLTSADSSKTGMISLFAIVLILSITFMHLVYTILPLFTIIFGVIWIFGFMALTGLKMTNFSSGAVSMIIGIGIDFGIQTIMRFRQELATAKPVLAMQKTMENVLKPMFITTVASFIGFWAMTYGDFLILGELGKIMALGVIFCFIAAITVVPAISVIYETHKPKKKLNSPIKIIKRFFSLITGKANLENSNK